MAAGTEARPAVLFVIYRWAERPMSSCRENVFRRGAIGHSKLCPYQCSGPVGARLAVPVGAGSPAL